MQGWKTSIALWLAGAAPLAGAQVAFTYQGELRDAGVLANGSYDVEACLYAGAEGGAALGCDTDNTDIPVQDGRLTLVLDFGPVFDGTPRFLELRVRPGADAGAFVPLTPRQSLRPTPEALRAFAADNAGEADAAPWSGLSGVPAGFADGLDADSGGDITGVIAAAGLSGGGTSGSVSLGINPAQVQVRVTGSCPVGQYLRAIAVNGDVTCEDLPLAPDLPGITVVADSPSTILGRFASMAIDASNRPVIAYHNATTLDLEVLRCGNATCTAGNVTSIVDDSAPNVGQHASLVLGDDGLPVIAYWESGAQALRVAKCGTPDCSSGNTITVVEDTASNVGQFAEITIGADGRPFVAYFDDTADALKVAHCGNDACSGGNVITTVDDPANVVGQFLSVARGSGGTPVIAYYDDTLDALKVLRCGNDDCTAGNVITNVDNPGNSVGKYTSIAIAADGSPRISYYDESAGALKLMLCSNAACSALNAILTLDDAGDVGQFSSIAIGIDGLPIISYRDATAGALKVVQCGDASCAGANSIRTVHDPETAVGEFTTIRIGREGLPAISYYDAGSFALRFLKCGTRACL